MIIKLTGTKFSFTTKKNLIIAKSIAVNNFRIHCSDFSPGIDYIEFTINELDYINEKVKEMFK